MKKVSDRGRRRRKTLHEVKPVENISKNVQVFKTFSRHKSHEKKILPSHKLRDHAYEY